MEQNLEHYQRACRVIPGGVNSPVRSFYGVDGTPVFIQSADGPYLLDEAGKRYIDYVGSWGPMILGHNHPEIKQAVIEACDKSLSFGAATLAEVELAETISTLIPSIEQLRMVNSGTEASMTAIRLARGFTQKNKIIKFDGCYHGHLDALLIKAGSGVLTLGLPGTAGIPASTVEHTLSAEFNNLDSVIHCLEQHKDDIAAIIIEPVAANMGCILPKPHFLQQLRELCDQTGALLIFDEVITGFRVALGGAQAIYGITPDLTILGKIIGGGLPVGAVGGKRNIMEQLAPIGPVYQAGTLSGNPIAVAAGLKTLRLLKKHNPYPVIEKMTQDLCEGITYLANQKGIALYTQWITGLLGLCFTGSDCVSNHADMQASNLSLFKRFFHQLLELGIYWPPSAFEASFISAAHQAQHIAHTLEKVETAFQSC